MSDRDIALRFHVLCSLAEFSLLVALKVAARRMRPSKGGYDVRVRHLAPGLVARFEG